MAPEATSNRSSRTRSTARNDQQKEQIADLNRGEQAVQGAKHRRYLCENTSTGDSAIRSDVPT